MMTTMIFHFILSNHLVCLESQPLPLSWVPPWDIWTWSKPSPLSPNSLGPSTLGSAGLCAPPPPSQISCKLTPPSPLSSHTSEPQLSPTSMLQNSGANFKFLERLSIPNPKIQSASKSVTFWALIWPYKWKVPNLTGWVTAKMCSMYTNCISNIKNIAQNCLQAMCIRCVWDKFYVQTWTHHPQGISIYVCDYFKISKYPKAESLLDHSTSDKGCSLCLSKLLKLWIHLSLLTYPDALVFLLPP